MAKKIMIVDDSPVMRITTKRVLESAGYEVLEAENGEDGLAKLAGDKVNLIISDVNMPVMDGIEFLKNVKQQKSYKFTPIIMLTTETQKGLMEQGKAAGARAWIVKPFKEQQLLDAVSKLII